MSGKPAARVSDPTACPVSGHGNNPIVEGSADVFFDHLPAARQGDATTCGAVLADNVIPNVFINGKPAAVVGTLGSHGNVIIGGSGTVIIGNTFEPAPFTPPQPMAGAASVAAAPESSAPGPLTALAGQALEAVASLLHGTAAEEEEEEEELTPDAAQGITLRIGFFFDGTGDNAENAARGAQCRASQLGYSPEQEQDLLNICPPYQMDALSSYGREKTNVWRLFELYQDDSQDPLPGERKSAFVPVYIEGVGTTPHEKDSTFPDMALGVGDTGVLEKAKKAAAEGFKAISLLWANNPQILIEAVEIDVFGFSRGAATARHFVNDLRNGESSYLAQALHTSTSPLAEDFAWDFGKGVKVNVIGLFDTVAAVGSFADGWDVHDDKNGDLKLYLAKDSAKRVIHLVAGDEYRHNFSLNSTAPHFSEIALPGAHGDIGGNYPLEAEEKLFLSRPYFSDVNNQVPKEQTPAWQAASRQLSLWQQHGLIDTAQANGRVYIDVRQSRSTDSPLTNKSLYTQVKLERKVRGEYGRIPLHIMHALALQAEVPFVPIPNTALYKLPSELVAIADKLKSYAHGMGTLDLSKQEQDLLYARYLHQSAHWNVYPGESGALTVHFVDRPAEGWRRAIYPNKPDAGVE